MIRTQQLQFERRVSRVLSKFFVSCPRRVANIVGKRPVTFPEGACSSGLHGRLSKSVSLISGNWSGFALYCASISSPNAESARRGRGSWMMSAHLASPFNSGSSAGKSATSFSRSVGGSARIAASISFAVLTVFETIANFAFGKSFSSRSEEHTSELQSRLHLVCRLLLEKKK